MRLYYSITAVDPAGQRARLLARLTLTSHEIYSPHVAVDDIDAGDQEDAGEGIDLGTVGYPRAETPGQVLPPFLLIEALDDPLTAEERYGTYGGYRYVGQLLLPDGALGETVEACLSREALALWEAWLPQSERHLRALHGREQDLAELFLLEEAPRPQGEALPPPVGSLVSSACSALAQGDPPARAAALRRLSQVDGQALPVGSIFPCLNDESDEVRQLALGLLCTARDRLPFERLERIIDQAELPARLAAITLLGKVGGDQAVSALECACNRRHPWVRMAGLRALFVACYGSDLHPVDYLDVLTYLRHALRSDDVAAVRDVAAELVDRLGGPAALDRLIAEHAGGA